MCSFEMQHQKTAVILNAANLAFFSGVKKDLTTVNILLNAIFVLPLTLRFGDVKYNPVLTSIEARSGSQPSVRETFTLTGLGPIWEGSHLVCVEA